MVRKFNTIQIAPKNVPTCSSCGIEYKNDNEIILNIIVYIIWSIPTLGLYLVLRPLWYLFSKKRCSRCTPQVPEYTGSDK